MQKTHPLLIPALLTALSGNVFARPDTLPDYDENSTQANTPDAFHTNHAGGYSGFTADIAAGWYTDEAGVNDEFFPYSDNAISLNGSPIYFGYGQSGYFDPVTGSPNSGNYATLEDKVHDWDWTTKPTGISGDTSLQIGSKSLGGNINVYSSASVPVLIMGFTVLGNTLGNVTATLNFSDGSSYSETFLPGKEGDVFFGGVAPTGFGIESFSLQTDDPDQTVFLDDLAISTAPALATPVPEASTGVLAMLTLMLGLTRRRRR